MMTVREFYLQRLEAEIPVFMNVFTELPQNKLDYKPDEDSPTAEELIWTITCNLETCLDVVKNNRAEHQSIPPPPVNQMLEMFEGWSGALCEIVGSMTEDAWERKAQFFHNGKLVSEQPVGAFLWFILFDSIHHRGQLAAYMRPM